MKLNQKTIDYAEKYLEYKKNPIKFIEECVMLPTPGESKPMKLYEPQKKVLKSFYDDKNLVLLKSRQTGFSTLTQAIITHLVTFFDNCVIGLVSRDAAESTDACRKIQNMIDALPDWIRPEYNNKAIQYFVMKNGSQFHTSAISPANPGAAFRGKSIVLLILDEAAHIPKIQEAWVGMAPALFKAQQSAREEGIPFGTIIVSTPNKTNGVGQFYFQQYNSAKRGESIFTTHEIHWSEIPAFRNDPDWYKTQCSLLGNDKRRIAQELECKFIGSESTLFSESVQEKLQGVKDEPKEIIKFENNSELWRFNNIRRGVFHILGVDTASEGGGTDYSTIQVIEYETMNQVLEFKGKLAVKKFANVVKLCSKMCPHNVIVIENNSYGNQVIEELRFDEEFEYNLYGETKSKMFSYGLNTNMKSRPLIVDALYNYVNENTDLICSERLALELLSLTNKKEKVEADSGFNDDLALAYGFCCYVRHYTPELLGNTDTLEDRENSGNASSIINSVNMIRGLNEPEAPLIGNYQSEPFDIFKKTLDKHIIENIGRDMSGPINTLEIFRKK